MIRALVTRLRCCAATARQARVRYGAATASQACIVLAVVVFSALPAQSHHSNVAYEVTKVITVTGVVKSFEWVNPHTWLHIVVDDGKGGKVEWAAEGRAPGILTRAGWTRNSLKAGETVTLDMSPAKDGSKVSIIARVTKADGTILSNQPVFDDRGN